MSTRTATATLAAALCLSVALALPAGAGANGGTSAPEPGVTGATAPGSTSAGTLASAPGALLGRRQRVTGILSGAPSGTTILLQRADGSGWITVARGSAGRGGAFAVTWRPERAGRLTLRAVRGEGASASAASAAPTARMTVYPAAIATHFGSGFYGSRTGCGTILTRETVGVAHKTLPCGTLIEFYYRGRTVRAPVIDRGPYANNAAWDLTMPASRALGFNGKDYVGAMSVGRVTLRRAR